MYIINLHGDIESNPAAKALEKMAFDTLDEALGHIAKLELDIEDDQVLVEEVSEKYKSRQVVWHFSGWHWYYDEVIVDGIVLEQGSLPGHTGNLYSEQFKE